MLLPGHARDDCRQHHAVDRVVRIRRGRPRQHDTCDRGIARGRFPILGRGDVFYHLTYIDDLVEGFRLCGETPRAAGPLLPKHLGVTLELDGDGRRAILDV